MDAEIAAMLKEMGIPSQLFEREEGEPVWRAGESHPEFIRERLDVLVSNATVLYRLGKNGGTDSPDYAKSETLLRAAAQDLKPFFRCGSLAYSKADIEAAEADFKARQNAPGTSYGLEDRTGP